MPPRISGSRVMHVMEDMRGRPKPINASHSKHPGFEAVAEGIARRQHYSVKRASKILASQTRGASASAKKKNPRLKRVKG